MRVSSAGAASPIFSTVVRFPPVAAVTANDRPIVWQMLAQDAKARYATAASLKRQAMRPGGLRSSLAGFKTLTGLRFSSSMKATVLGNQF
jgi:hypothetical protein